MKIVRLPEQDPFIAGTNERINIPVNQIAKLEGATIFFCHHGTARLEIDLQAYEIVENTQLVLLPGSIVNSTHISPDFTASYVDFSKTLFEEITSRLDPSFFHFLKEHPCIIVPEERVKPLVGLTLAMEDLYKDRENSFRLQIFKNYVQNFLLDFYDKTQHLFLQKKPDGPNRQEELFKHFIRLIHAHCMTQREVSFYAAKLFITPRYLSSVVQNVSGTTAKNIIDRHVILEIKALLQSTELSIQEIANRLQFPDQSFFGRYFKKHTGISPMNYRRTLS
ncbi:helix-turn-helix domain-containing protein [uncultured Parabacteroides sp.]|uniref:AraC family transcriptional regulator n=1 Tax=uncultured Parabacteroides sp. TaxID=512312 RepID=UPI00261F42D1|nr:helix-turn-helix domain-containing protein [uncultured Parabacteroides sp.]